MRSRLVQVVIGIAACAALALPGMAGGAERASTKVTIKVEGSGDFLGYVKSSKPKQCADGRKITLFRKRKSGDEKVASDTASKNGDRYQWSTGNTGLKGRFYARARKTEKCKGATSKTVKSE